MSRVYAFDGIETKYTEDRCPVFREQLPMPRKILSSFTGAVKIKDSQSIWGKELGGPRQEPIPVVPFPHIGASLTVAIALDEMYSYSEWMQSGS